MKDKREMMFVRFLLVVFAIATGGLFFWVHKTDRSYEIYRAKHQEKASENPH